MEENIIATMHKRGLKVSKKRIWIVEAICRVKFILDVEEFWISLRSVRPVSWATTYSTLRVLSEHGIIEKVNKGSKAVTYRLVDCPPD